PRSAQPGSRGRDPSHPVEVVSEIRDRLGLPIGLLSDRPDKAIRPLAESIGASFHAGALTDEARADLLRTCRQRGIKTAYVSHGREHPDAAREAHVSISFAGELDLERDPADFLMLRRDLRSLINLINLAREHRQRVQTVHGLTLIPNLTCVAGAFLLGFSGLTSVIVTNLGIFSVY